MHTVRSSVDMMGFDVVELLYDPSKEKDILSQKKIRFRVNATLDLYLARGTRGARG
jgi:hypothetical protein